jgi:hypothetical protein
MQESPHGQVPWQTMQQPVDPSLQPNAIPDAMIAATSKHVARAITSIAKSEDSTGDVRAAGDAQDGVVSLRTFAASSERGRFAAQPTADPAFGDNRLSGVAAPADDESWAVGSFIDDSSGNLQTLIVTGGEGSTWTQVPSPSPSSDGDTQLSTITSVRGGGLWAVGGFDGPDAQQALVLHRCR